MQAGIDVLIVDDSDADVRDTLQAIRSALSQPAVTRMKDGDAAAQFMFRTGMFQDRPAVLPRLVLLEIDIPIVHGLELLRRLRRDPATREIPLVVLSANRNPVVMEEAYLLGAREYLAKPHDRDEYVAEVAKLVSRWVQAPPTQ